MTDYDEHAFAGWLRIRGFPWRRVSTGATEGECLERLRGCGPAQG